MKGQQSGMLGKETGWNFVQPWFYPKLVKIKNVLIQLPSTYAGPIGFVECDHAVMNSNILVLRIVTNSNTVRLKYF